MRAINGAHLEVLAMLRGDGKRILAEEPQGIGQTAEDMHVVPPRCISNNTYKHWRSSVDDKAPAARTAVPAPGGHSSWFARLRFSFFHR